MSVLSNNVIRAIAVFVPFMLGACAQTVEVTKFDHSDSYLNTIHELDRQFEVSHFSTVHFEFDLDVLDADAMRRLDRQAALINQHPDVQFTVTGHTDLVGNEAYNMDLGMRRAVAVLDYLVSKGVQRGQLLAMVSAGEENPLDAVDTPQRLNRRVTTAVLMPEMAEFQTASRSSKPQPTAPTSPVPVVEPQPDADEETDRQKNPNSGRGNGDEEGDPGKADGKNKGGDEL